MDAGPRGPTCPVGGCTLTPGPESKGALVLFQCLDSGPEPDSFLWLTERGDNRLNQSAQRDISGDADGGSTKA